MPKEKINAMDRVMWLKLNWDSKYIEPSATKIAIIKMKKQEEQQKKNDKNKIENSTSSP